MSIGQQRGRGSAFRKHNPGTCTVMQYFQSVFQGEEEHGGFELDGMHSHGYIRQTQSYEIVCTFLLDTQISLDHTGLMKANITYYCIYLMKSVFPTFCHHEQHGLPKTFIIRMSGNLQLEGRMFESEVRKKLPQYVSLQQGHKNSSKLIFQVTRFIFLIHSYHFLSEKALLKSKFMFHRNEKLYLQVNVTQKMAIKS